MFTLLVLTPLGRRRPMWDRRGDSGWGEGGARVSMSTAASTIRVVCGACRRLNTFRAPAVSRVQLVNGVFAGHADFLQQVRFPSAPPLGRKPDNVLVELARRASVAGGARRDHQHDRTVSSHRPSCQLSFDYGWSRKKTTSRGPIAMVGALTNPIGSLGQGPLAPVWPAQPCRQA